MSNAIYLAYAVLGALAVSPIYFGSFDSIKALKTERKNKEPKAFPLYSDSDDSDEETDSVSSKDAYMFPVYGSIALFSLYMVLKYLNKDYVNILLSVYFSFAGIGATSQAIVTIAKKVTRKKLPLFHLSLTYKAKQEFLLKFTNLHITSVIVATVVVGFYVYSKNWIISNVIGYAFCLTAISIMKLDSISSGIIMLTGLFFYDIFWVFGTEVMVSVAKNLNAPIKLVFPRNVFDSTEVNKFVMLGLGDIIVPGVFIALCLRFDHSQYLKKIGYKHRKPLPSVLKGKKNNFAFPTPYFTTCLIAYFGGLVATVFVMHTFKAAQPALLYLSPACSISVVILAAARGEISELFAYNEDTSSDKEGKASKDQKSQKSSAESKKAQPALPTLPKVVIESVPTESTGEMSDDEAEPRNLKSYALRNRTRESADSDSASASQTPKPRTPRKSKKKN